MPARLANVCAMRLAERAGLCECRAMRRQRRAIALVLGEARRALGMTQEQFGTAVGSSHRSAVRWDANQATPAVHQLHNLARLLHPQHRLLAIEVADEADETLESLGLEMQAPPPPPPAPPALPEPRATAEELVGLLVLTAVEQTGASPASVRPWLHAVMKRGAELRLTMDIAERALRPAAAEGPVIVDGKPQK
jgi:transcriptional regulator with XRE-family HTH domain